MGPPPSLRLVLRFEESGVFFMIRSELHGERCHGCGAPLTEADYYERHPVVFARGEFAGCRGVVIVAECSCGHTKVVPLSVDLRPAA